MKNISVVIVSWNGKVLLERFLPTVLRAAKFYNSQTQIIVVDDGSSDGTREFLRSSYPQTELISFENNRGFSVAANTGIEASKNELVVLLNNDVEPKEDFLQFLPDHFNDSAVFAIRIKSIIVENKRMDSVESWVGGTFRRGFIYGLNEKEYAIKDGLSFTAGGGAMALDKVKFLELGGFDNIFSPFYWEDVDLSYRAWKRCYKIIYEPHSVIYHYHRSTISQMFNSNYIAFIGERNRYLVVWKNIFDTRYLLQHFILIPLRLMKNLFTGKLALVFAFFAAIGRLKMVLNRRRIERQEAKRTDKEIFSIFKTFKVLYIDEWGDLHGGGQIYLLSLFTKLDRNKFIPLCVCPFRGSLVDAIEKLGIRVEIIKMKRLINPLNIFSLLSSIMKIILLIKKENIDLIHSNAAIRGTIYSGIAAKITRIPFIWQVHILSPAGLIDRFLTLLATKIIVVAKAVKARFRWLKESKKIIINYNGVDLEKFNPHISKMGIREKLGLGLDIPVVGVIGILHPQKGQEYLLQAAGKVKEGMPDVKFLIVGEDVTKKKSCRIKLENLIKALDLSENVIFTGWLNNIPEVLAGIDIFVLPSLVDHFPLVVLEAMASGKPVIATDVGGVPEMVEDGISGVLVSPKDVKGLSKTIVSLLKDGEKAKRMGMAGRRRVEEFFGIEANRDRVEQIYKDLLEERY